VKQEHSYLIVMPGYIKVLKLKDVRDNMRTDCDTVFQCWPYSGTEFLDDASHPYSEVKFHNISVAVV